MTELEDKCGLIERKRQGLGKPNLIYVKNFISAVDNPVYNSPASHFKKCENHDSGSVIITSPDSRKSHGSNTDNNDTDMSYTENPIYPGRDTDGMAERRSYESYFRDALEFDLLLQQYPYDRETLQEILDLLIDTVCTKREYIRIASDDRPRDVVKSRFMKLNSGHIQYVLECLKKNTTDVHNIKQYLLAALYNASATISSYYQARVNYDFYGSHD